MINLLGKRPWQERRSFSELTWEDQKDGAETNVKKEEKEEKKKEAEE